MCRKILSKEYWKKGSSEYVGFLVAIPAITIIALLLVSVIQMGMVKTRLEYAAYCAARAAAVSETFEEANEQAKESARANLSDIGTASVIFKDAYVKVIDPESGDEIDAPKKKKDIKNKIHEKASGGDDGWGKGTYIETTVVIDVDTFMIFTSGEKRASLVMLVEEDAGNLFDIVED